MQDEVDVANSDMEFIPVNLQCETLLETFFYLDTLIDLIRLLKKKKRNKKTPSKVQSCHNQ